MSILAVVAIALVAFALGIGFAVLGFGAALVKYLRNHGLYNEAGQVVDLNTLRATDFDFETKNAIYDRERQVAYTREAGGNLVSIAGQAVDYGNTVIGESVWAAAYAAACVANGIAPSASTKEVDALIVKKNLRKLWQKKTRATNGKPNNA